MSEFASDFDPWLPAGLVMAAMLLSWAFGWWRGRAIRGQDDESGGSKFGDGIMALFGLLLAFTFSMSLSKHEGRRQMSISDSNAVGDFYTCVSLLEEPERGKLQELLKRYLEERIALAHGNPEETVLQQKLTEIQEMHAEMHSLVKQAIDRGTPAVVPLVNTFNDVTSNHAARLAAVRDRLPCSILLLLGLSGVFAVAVMAKQQSASKESAPFATFGFIVIVSLVILVILDLNEPQRGWIRISQEPLERLLGSF